MDFGQALEAIKNGKKASRKGWNGKEQFICIAEMEKCNIPDEIILNPRHDAIGNRFIMFVGTSGYQCGWLASQSDMLAEDWIIKD